MELPLPKYLQKKIKDSEAVLLAEGLSVTKKKEIYEDYARKTHEELGSTKKEEIYEKSAQKSHENFEEKDHYC